MQTRSPLITVRRSVLVAALLLAAAVESSSQPRTIAIAGTWNVHIEHFTGRVVNEQWLIRQTDRTLAGKVVVSSREFPLEGTIEGNEITVKVTVRPATSDEPASVNVFHGLVDGDSMKGEIKKVNDDGLFAATRAKQ